MKQWEQGGEYVFFGYVSLSSQALVLLVSRVRF